MKKIVDYASTLCCMSDLVHQGVSEDYLRTHPAFVKERKEIVRQYLMGPGTDYLDVDMGEIIIRLKGWDEAGYLYGELS